MDIYNLIELLKNLSPAQNGDIGRSWIHLLSWMDQIDSGGEETMKQASQSPGHCCSCHDHGRP